MKVPFVDLLAQYHTIKEEADAAVARVLSRGDFVMGQAVDAFEAEFARYCEADFAIGVDSGYSALELILRGYEIGPGDEVITAANTFIATALAITTCGAKPVLVDAHPTTYNLDPAQIEAAITPRTRAIMPVHLYGQPADMDPILEIAHKHELLVVEDAAQAAGARYKGRRSGSLGHAAAFSFYPAKNLGAYGDGGAIVTSDATLAERVRLLRNLGQRAKYQHEVQGYNHRLDTLQAAVLSVKLPHLDRWNAARRAHAQRYAQLLSDLPVTLPAQSLSTEALTAEPAGPEPVRTDSAAAEHIFHLYVIRTPERTALQQHLNHAGIATGIHYPVPIHLQPAYRELGYKQGDFPVTEAWMDEILSLPMYPELSPVAIEYVAHTMRQALRHAQAAPPEQLVQHAAD